MTNPLRVTPPALRGGAGVQENLAHDAEQLSVALRAAWSRLDGGWQSYAREDVETTFDASLAALSRKSQMLRQLASALRGGADVLESADDAAAACFEAGEGDALAPVDGISDAGSAIWNDGAGAGVDTPVIFGLPVDASGLGPPPGVKISSDEVVVEEACRTGVCHAVTAQGSASVSTDGSATTMTFSMQSGNPRGIEVSLGELGTLKLGKLSFSERGMEHSAPVPGTTLERRLPDGTVLRSQWEYLPPLPREYRDQSGVTHIATSTGIKFVITVVTAAGAIIMSDSFTVRDYTYPGNPDRAAPRPRPNPRPLPGGGSGGSGPFAPPPPGPVIPPIRPVPVIVG